MQNQRNHLDLTKAFDVALSKTTSMLEDNLKLRMHYVLLVSLLFLLLLSSFTATRVAAQSTNAEKGRGTVIMPAPGSTVSDSELGTDKGRSRPASAQFELSKLRSEFDLLKITGIASSIVASCLGLFWYWIRHKRLQPYDTTGGLLITLICAPLLLLAAMQLLSTDASACLNLRLAHGAEVSPFFDQCRASRESAANMIGLKSLWTLAFGQAVVDGVVVPLSTPLLKTLMFTSVIAFAVLFFFLLKPILRKFALYKTQ